MAAYKIASTMAQRAVGEKDERDSVSNRKQREVAEARGDRIVNLATLRTAACSQTRVPLSGA